MPKPEPLVEESNEDEVEYVDDSIYSGSSTYVKNNLGHNSQYF